MVGISYMVLHVRVQFSAIVMVVDDFSAVVTWLRCAMCSADVVVVRWLFEHLFSGRLMIPSLLLF